MSYSPYVIALIALPFSFSAKSCTLTFVFVPLPCHSAPTFFELPDQLLLLGVHGNDGLLRSLVLFDALTDVLELIIPIRMLLSFLGLPICLQRIAQPHQHAVDAGWAAFKALGPQFIRKFPPALARPPIRP